MIKKLFLSRSYLARSYLSQLALPILALPRPAKRMVVLTVDLCLCVLAVWLAYFLRLGEFVSFTGQSTWAGGMALASAVSIATALPLFVVSGLYRAIFRYGGWPALLAVAKAVGIYSVIYASIFTVMGATAVPRTVGLIQPILLLLLVGSSRAFARVWLGEKYQSILQRASRPKVLIYGAGHTGRQLVAAMANNHEMQVVGFLDDDERLQGQLLYGQPIYGVGDLESLIHELEVKHVLLAMPSIGRNHRNQILANLAPYKVAVRTLPSFNDLAQGKVSVSDVRELDVDDLLGREPVQPDTDLLHQNIGGKTVLVTGAGGSIGSELCRQIVACQPKQLLLVEVSEVALYQIHRELEALLLGERLSLNDHVDEDFAATVSVELIPLLASACDSGRMQEIMQTWRPHTVYHAAAYKHVPLVEHNPAAGVRNNVWGTWVCAEAALLSGAENFVLISTDKAVRPTNIMGASKRLAEMVLQAIAARGGHATAFSMVRFGNVLGSSGSVVPLFRQQIKNGGPITLTHLEITRYFMTIPEAAQLVIQAGAMGYLDGGMSGDVFVLDMGEPVKIIDLAHRMIELSGLTVKDASNAEGDIEISVTGLRPGEKLFEEMLIGDNPEATVHPRILKAREHFLPWHKLEARLEVLNEALTDNNIQMTRGLLSELVNGYQPSGDIVDWIHLAINHSAVKNS